MTLAMLVPPTLTSACEGAHSLQSVRGMPRKQRFKPSRKPQNQASVSNQQVDDRQEIEPEQREVQRQGPEQQGQRDIEHDRE